MAWNVPTVMGFAALPSRSFRRVRISSRCLMGKGHGGDLLRRHLPPLHQIGDALHQCAGLARSGACYHGDDFFLRMDGFLLLRIIRKGSFCTISSDSASAVRAFTGCFFALGAAKPASSSREV